MVGNPTQAGIKSKDSKQSEEAGGFPVSNLSKKLFLQHILMFPNDQIRKYGTVRSNCDFRRPGEGGRVAYSRWVQWGFDDTRSTRVKGYGPQFIGVVKVQTSMRYTVAYRSA